MLPFAPRIALLLASAACLAAPALAQDISTQDVYACAAIETDAARLACYDDAAGRLQAAEAAGEVTTITRADVEQVKQESFGFAIPSLPKIAMPSLGDRAGDEVERIESAITSTGRGGDGKLLVRLENGQIWRQIDTKKVRVSRKAPPTSATVRTAALGSFMMKFDTGPAFRVKREK